MKKKGKKETPKIKIKGFTVVLEYSKLLFFKEHKLKDQLDVLIGNWFCENANGTNVVVKDIDKDYRCGYLLTKLRNWVKARR